MASGSDSEEESQLFRSLTDIDLTDEQLDQYHQLKKSTRGFVVDSQLSESFSESEELSCDDLRNKTNPDSSRKCVELLKNPNLRLSDDLDNTEEDNSSIEWLGRSDVDSIQKDPILNGSKVDETYEDDKNDKDYDPPRSLKRRTLTEKQDLTKPSTSKLWKAPEKTAPKKRKVTFMDLTLGPETAVKKEKTKQQRVRNRLPADMEGLIGQATLCYIRNDTESAITMCQQVHTTLGPRIETYEMLGMIYEKSGNIDKQLEAQINVVKLKNTDPEEWTRLAEIFFRLDKVNEVVRCYEQVVRFDSTKYELMRVLADLYERSNCQWKHKAMLERLVRSYKPEDGKAILEVTKEIVEKHFNNGDVKLAMKTMEEAVYKNKLFVKPADINILLDLKINLKEYAQSVKILCDFREIKFEPPFEPELEIDVLESTLKSRQSCSTPEDLPIEFCAKLIICCLHLQAYHLTNDMKMTLIETNPEENGDLYLDVAEAYMETGHSDEAIPLLAMLTLSEKYNKPLVWKKYGECQMAAGNLEEAEKIYRHLLELEPNHEASRIVLSAIFQQLGRADDCLQVLSGFEPSILIHKANLLYSRGEWEEFVAVGKTLHDAHTLWNDGGNSFNYTNPCTVNKVRDLYKTWKLEMTDKVLIEEGSELTEEIWDIYKKMCQKMLHLKQLKELQAITLSAMASSIFTHRDKLKDCHFMHFLACFYNKDFERAYSMFIGYVSNGETHNRSWNLFNLVANSLPRVMHNRFCTRQAIKFLDHPQLEILNGHTSFAAGSYDHAMHDYLNAYRRNPQNPFNAFFVALTYSHMACQRYTTDKDETLVQVSAFFDTYRELRGDTQETCYNMGRAMHQLGLSYLAVAYYKQALAMKPAITSGPNAKMYDLSHDAAYNLALIYIKSGSHDLARMYLYTYCVV